MDRAARIGCVAGAGAAFALTIALLTLPAEPSGSEQPWPLSPRYGEESPDVPGPPEVSADAERGGIVLLPPATGRAVIERW